MRVMGVDLGERRIGIALSDRGGVLATPHLVVVRSGDERADLLRLARLVEEEGAETVVVGLPLSLGGKRGPAARAAAAEIEALSHLVAVPVVAFDERLTTVEAARRRRERAGTPARGRAGRRGPRGRAGGRVPAIDAEAAAIMLEAFLAAQPDRADGVGGDSAASSHGPGDGDG